MLSDVLCRLDMTRAYTKDVSLQIAVCTEIILRKGLSLHVPAAVAVAVAVTPVAAAESTRPHIAYGVDERSDLSQNNSNSTDTPPTGSASSLNAEPSEQRLVLHSTSLESVPATPLPSQGHVSAAEAAGLVSNGRPIESDGVVLGIEHGDVSNSEDDADVHDDSGDDDLSDDEDEDEHEEDDENGEESEDDEHFDSDEGDEVLLSC